MDFAIPALTQNIRDLELPSGEDGRLRLTAIINAEELSSKEQDSISKDLLEQLDRCSDPTELLQENCEWINRFYSFVRYFEFLSTNAKAIVLDISRGLLEKVSRTIRELDNEVKSEEIISKVRCSFKFATYILAKLCVEEETRLSSGASIAPSSKAGKKSNSKSNKSKANEYVWSDYRELMLRSLLSSIRTRGNSHSDAEVTYTNFGKLWTCALPEEAFLDLLWRTSETMVLENPKLATASDTNDLLEVLVCAPVHHFHEKISHLVAASFTHALRKHDNMPIFITNVLKRLVTEFDDSKLAREMILEIGRVDTQEVSRDSSGIKLLGSFIELLSEELPALVLANLSVLVPHLSAQAHQLRCAIVRSLGSLVAHLKAVESSTIEASDSDQQQSNTNNDTKATRDNILDLIGERSQDTSSYVRAASLNSLAELCLSSSLPLSHLHVACDIGIERLLDKSSLVRKQAIACLCAMLENNPYSDRLDPSFFRTKIEESAAKLPQAKEKSTDTPVSQEMKEEGEEENEDNDQNAKESSHKVVEDSEEGASVDGPESDSENDEMAEEADPAVLAALEYYKSALGFAARMELACTQTEQLVCSTSVTDVLESLRFLSAAFRFQLPAALDSIRKLFALIWDDRESGRVKKELLETFELIFISEPVQVGRSTKRRLYAEDVVANNLIGLVLNATLSELTCLEAIVADLVVAEGTLKRMVLPMVVIERIWEVACAPPEDNDAASLSRARAAMCLIAMTANASKTLFEKKASYVTKLQNEILAKTNDFGIARYALLVLGHIVDHTQIQPRQSEQIESITIALVCKSNKHMKKGADQELEWYPTVENALQILVKTNPRPDLACASLVRKVHKKVFSNSNSDPIASELAQLFFLVGHVAIQLLVYSDVLGSKSKKLRRGKQQLSEEKRSKAEQEELTMLGANEDAGDDFEEAVLRRISEQELVGEKSLLGSYVPLMAAVVESGLVSDTQKRCDDDVEQDGDSYAPDAVLMESATLALCKMCCISNNVCEKYLRLLLTVLRDSCDPNVRSNIMIALGDLAVRFPNTIEPFTSQVYRRLRDPDVGVRKTSLMCLSHLILNDMLKVRGEVSEILACVEDKDSVRIRDLACLFFHEMSRKGTHPIYNLLIDTVNKLSKDPNVDGEKFQKLATFLMQFITLDKHVVSITEKLCQRIFAATGLTTGAEEVESVSAVKDIKICRDMAFCLSQLKPSDRSIAKLADDGLFKLYKPVLADEAIHTSFVNIIRKARQFSKPETKQLLDDWVQRIDAVREVHISNHATTTKAKKVAASTRRKVKTTTRRVTKSKTKAAVSNKENTSRQRQKQNYSSSEEEDVLASEYSSSEDA